MKSSTKRVLSIGLSLIFFAAIIIVYVNLISPEFAEIQKKRALLSSKENLFNNQRAAVLAVQKIISEFQSVAQLEETISLAIPLEENTTQALNQLQGISRNSQANISAVTIEPLALSSTREPLVKRFGALELNLTVQGAYENLKSFLRFLETNVRVANVKSFHLTPAGQNRNQDFYNLSVKADIYYQDDK